METSGKVNFWWSSFGVNKTFHPKIIFVVHNLSPLKGVPKINVLNNVENGGFRVV